MLKHQQKHCNKIVNKPIIVKNYIINVFISAHEYFHKTDYLKLT